MKSATNTLKTASKRVIQKTAEATDVLIGNKVADKNKKNSLQNNSDTDSETEKLVEILRKKYISPKKRQWIVDDLRLMW